LRNGTMKKLEGKTIAKVTKETIEEPKVWGDIFDRLTIRFTDGTEAKFESQFCSQGHSEIAYADDAPSFSDRKADTWPKHASR